MPEPYLLGLDFGTQSAKALLLNQRGQICASAQKEYGILSTHSGFAEQNPKQWEEALSDICCTIRKKEPAKFSAVCAVGISGQMHGLVLLDAYHQPLGTSLLWNDVRGDPCHVKTRLQQLGIDLPNPVTTAFSAVKLDWLSKERPKELVQTRKVLFVKDYIHMLLTGEINTDPTDASGSLMYDFKTHAWHDGIEKGMNLPRHVLPPIMPSIGRRGTVNRQAAERFAIEENTPIYAAGGDLACGAMGAGLFEAGATLIILGTAGQVLDISPNFCAELVGKKFFFQNYDGTHILGLCALPSAGQSLSWLVKIHNRNYSLSDIDEIAAEIPVGSDGLLFTPYLQGSGSPYMDETVRGSFVGLSSSHTFAHLARAVMEGVCLGVKDCVQLNGEIPSFIRFAGGGSKSAFWAQMMADVLDTRIQCLLAADASPLGAALLAGVGCGLLGSVGEAASLVMQGRTYTPLPENATLYRTIFTRYNELYPILSHFYKKS